MKRRVARKNRQPDVVIDKIASDQFAQFDSLAKRLFAVPKSEVEKLERKRKKRSRLTP